MYAKRPQSKNYGLIFCPNLNHLELLFSLFFFTSSTIWVPVTIFHSLHLSKSISYLKITPWFSIPLANQKSQRSFSSLRLFFPAEGFPSIYTAVLRTLINGGKRKKYCLQYFYSHSSFPNVRYIPNRSKYYILFFGVSANPSNYRTFSNF